MAQRYGIESPLNREIQIAAIASSIAAIWAGAGHWAE
jgi:hypothetical protein